MEDTDDDVMAVTDSEEDLHPSEIRKRCMFLHNTKLTARLSTFSFYCKSLSTIQHDKLSSKWSTLVMHVHAVSKVHS